MARPEDILEQGRMELEKLRLDAQTKIMGARMAADAKEKALRAKLKQKFTDQIIKGQQAQQKIQEAKAAGEDYQAPATPVPPPQTKSLQGVPTEVDSAAMVQRIMANPASVQGGAAVQGGGGEMDFGVPPTQTSISQRQGVDLVPHEYGILPIQTSQTEKVTQSNVLTPGQALQARIEMDHNQKLEEIAQQKATIAALDYQRKAAKTVADIDLAQARMSNASASQRAALALEKKRHLDIAIASENHVEKTVSREVDSLAEALLLQEKTGEDQVSTELQRLQGAYGDTGLVPKILTRAVTRSRALARENADKQSRLNDPSRRQAIQEAIQDLKLPEGHPQRQGAELFLQSISGRGVRLEFGPGGTLQSFQQGGLPTASLSQEVRHDISAIEGTIGMVDRMGQIIDENPNLIGPAGMLARGLTRITGAGGAVAQLFGSQEAFNEQVEATRAIVEQSVGAGIGDAEVRSLLDPQRLGELEVLENMLAVRLADALFKRHLSAEAVKLTKTMVPKLASINDPSAIRAQLKTFREQLTNQLGEAQKNAAATGIPLGGVQGGQAGRKSVKWTVDDLKKMLTSSPAE